MLYPRWINPHITKNEKGLTFRSTHLLFLAELRGISLASLYEGAGPLVGTPEA